MLVLSRISKGHTASVNIWFCSGRWSVVTEIISIPLFGDNCYVLRDRGVVEIDCGLAGDIRK